MPTTLETLEQSLTAAVADLATAKQEKASTDQLLADTQAVVADTQAVFTALMVELRADFLAKLDSVEQQVGQALAGKAAAPAPSEPAAPTTPAAPATPAPEPTAEPAPVEPAPTTPAPTPEPAPAPAPTPEPAPAPTPTDTTSAPAPAPTNPGGGQDVRLAPDPAKGPPNGIMWQDPITLLSEMRDADGIIRLKGHYRSTRPDVPAILGNCGDTPVQGNQNVVWSAGDGIHMGGSANLTLRDFAHYGLNLGVDNLTRGNSIYAWNATNIDLQYITQESAGGMLFQLWRGNHTPSQTLKIQNVRSRNVIGGDAGWRGGLSGPQDGREYRHCIQLKDIHTKGMLLNWIESFNEADKSRIEDHINLFRSGGLDADNPLLGTGFYLHGSYPFPASGNHFTGAALSADGQVDGQLDDGSGPQMQTQFTKLTKGYAVSNGNAAFNIAAGSNISYEDVRAVTSGLLADGSPLNCSYAGAYVGDYFRGGTMHDNYIRNLAIAFMRTTDVRQRQDISPDSMAGAILFTTPLPTPTLASEAAEFLAWRDLLNANNQVCGARFRSA